MKYQTAKEAIGYLNEQRVANGIPGGLKVVPQLSLGCNQYERKYVPSPTQPTPHEELKSQPGYTKLGDQAARSSDLGGGVNPLGPSAQGQLLQNEVLGAWGVNSFDNAWNEAPLHLSLLFNPSARYAWYGNGPRGQCMGTSGVDPFGRLRSTRPSRTDRFYSLPGHGADGVPVAEAAISESPFSPQDAAHLGQGVTGPNILLMVVGPRPSLRHVTLVGPRGPASVVVVSPKTPAPWNYRGETVGSFTPDTWYVIPRRPLIGHARYTLTAQWASANGSYHHTQHSAFSTVCSIDAWGWSGPIPAFPGCPQLDPRKGS